MPKQGARSRAPKHAEDKLAAAPAGRRYSAEQIAALVEFQERYFDTTITVLVEQQFGKGEGI